MGYDREWSFENGIWRFEDLHTGIRLDLKFSLTIIATNRVQFDDTQLDEFS